MSSLPKLALFDGGWLMHRAAFAIAKHRPNSWVREAPGLFANWVFTSALRLKAKHVAVLFDSDTSFRKRIYANYKSNRGGGEGDTEEVEHSPYEAKAGIIAMLDAHNVPYHEEPGYEADDLFAAFVSLAKGEYHCYLVTKDKDMVQLVSDTVHCYLPPLPPKNVEVFTTPDTVQELRLGLTASQFLDYQTLIGDAIDTVPGVIKPGAARKLLREHGSLKHYFRTKEGRAFWDEHQESLTRNRKLVKLASSAITTLPRLEVRPIARLPRGIQSPKSYAEYARFAFSNTRSLF